MWTDPKVWIPIITAVVTASATFLWQYLGNSEFRKNIKAGFSWCWAKVFKEQFFLSVYIPLLLICMTVLYRASFLSLETFLTAYSVWVTVWCIYLARKKRNVSTIVSCRLGDEGSERGNDGLVFVRYSDGDAPKELLNGNFVRRTNFSTGSYYIYFRIRNDVAKNFRGRHCITLVEFLDKEIEGSFDLQYDSKDSKHPNPRYKSTEHYPYSGGNKWRLAKFNMSDPAFKQRENGNSDFRLRICPRVDSSKPCPDLYLRKVVCLSLND